MWLSIFLETTPNYDHIIPERKVQLLENKITECKIRLGWKVPNLELQPYENGNKEQIKFIYDLKKEVYQKYVEENSVSKDSLLTAKDGKYAIWTSNQTYRHI